MWLALFPISTSYCQLSARSRSCSRCCTHCPASPRAIKRPDYKNVCVVDRLGTAGKFFYRTVLKNKRWIVACVHTRLVKYVCHAARVPSTSRGAAKIATRRLSNKAGTRAPNTPQTPCRGFPAWWRCNDPAALRQKSGRYGARLPWRSARATARSPERGSQPRGPSELKPGIQGGPARRRWSSILPSIARARRRRADAAWGFWPPHAASRTTRAADWRRPEAAYSRSRQGGPPAPEWGAPQRRVFRCRGEAPRRAFQAIQQLVDGFVIGAGGQQIFVLEALRNLADQLPSGAGKIGQRGQHPYGRSAEGEQADQLDAVAREAAHGEVIRQLALRRISAFHLTDIFDQEAQRVFDQRRVEPRAAHGARQRHIAQFAQQAGAQRAHGT